jgi:lipopolysaccharide transport protein LptA
MKIKYTTVMAMMVMAGLQAQEAGQCDQPVDVSADAIDTEIESGQSTLTGNVRISQCALQIEADEAVITMAKRQVQSLRLTGTPVQVDQDDPKMGKIRASATRVDYDLPAAQMVFTGNALIIHPQGQLSGEVIRYDIQDNRFQGGGASDDGRIKIRLDAPGQAPATPPENPEGS